MTNISDNEIAKILSNNHPELEKIIVNNEKIVNNAKNTLNNNLNYLESFLSIKYESIYEIIDRFYKEMKRIGREEVIYTNEQINLLFQKLESLHDEQERIKYNISRINEFKEAVTNNEKINTKTIKDGIILCSNVVENYCQNENIRLECLNKSLASLKDKELKNALDKIFKGKLLEKKGFFLESGEDKESLDSNILNQIFNNNDFREIYGINNINDFQRLLDIRIPNDVLEKFSQSLNPKKNIVLKTNNFDELIQKIATKLTSECIVEYIKDIKDINLANQMLKKILGNNTKISFNNQDINNIKKTLSEIVRGSFNRINNAQKDVAKDIFLRYYFYHFKKGQENIELEGVDLERFRDDLLTILQSHYVKFCDDSISSQQDPAEIFAKTCSAIGYDIHSYNDCDISNGKYIVDNKQHKDFLVSTQSGKGFKKLSSNQVTKINGKEFMPMGFIVHYGDNNSGHYVLYNKEEINGQERWFSYNDNLRTEIEGNEIEDLIKKAYIVKFGNRSEKDILPTSHLPDMNNQDNRCYANSFLRLLLTMYDIRNNNILKESDKVFKDLLNSDCKNLNQVQRSVEEFVNIVDITKYNLDCNANKLGQTLNNRLGRSVMFYQVPTLPIVENKNKKRIFESISKLKESSYNLNL